MKLKLAYFGSPDFSARFLEKILTDPELKKNISVEFVVTQPDKPVGRKQILTPTPVKQIAKKYNLKVFEIENLINEDSLKIENLKLKIKNSNLCLVYAYSSIIPEEFLNQPKYGFWCLHPSLLPKYRGPSPIAFALINGEKETGITIFKMDEKIDHGPIIAQKSLTIENNDYRTDLEKKLTDLGFELFKKIINKLVSWQVSKLKKEEKLNLTFKNQDDSKATYTHLLKKEDGFIAFSILKKVLNSQFLTFEEIQEMTKKNPNFEILNPKQILNSNVENSKQFKNSSKIIYNLFRGLSPWPGIWTILPNGKRLKITNMNFNPQNSILNITRVQLEGKKEVDFETFKKAYGFF
jgi:methionyl-tRNA formyltransferase